VILSDATKYDASRASGGLKEFSQVALQLQGSKLRQGFLTNANLNRTGFAGGSNS
jgi:hypothetical protein